jgi:hypothetical protein
MYNLENHLPSQVAANAMCFNKLAEAKLTPLIQSDADVDFCLLDIRLCVDRLESTNSFGETNCFPMLQPE